jgi:hypothetical protein
VFLTSGWARVLQDSYGHQPVYLCNLSDSGQVAAVFPIMELCSPWVGKRAASLPFTDFCVPQGRPNQIEDLFRNALLLGPARGWRYVQCRGGDLRHLKAIPSLQFHGHVIDLHSDEKTLFSAVSPPFRRSVRKAERAGLKVQFSQTSESMHVFYRLHCQTRRRHGLPPQPWKFFANITRHMLQSGRATLATVFRDTQAVASAVVLYHGKQACFKFGASDDKHRDVRPNNFLMWQLVRWAAEQGFDQLHLGRTSLANPGLRRFKLALGAREESVEYFNYNFQEGGFVRDQDRSETWLNHVFRRLPVGVLRLIGKVVYPHIS